MAPKKVLDAVYEQLRPLVEELARYNKGPNASVRMEFPEGFVRFNFKEKEKDENNN